MNEKQQTGLVFALLFASGEPIETEKLAQCAGLTVLETAAALDAIDAELARSGLGVELMRYESRVQLATRSEYAQAVNEMLDTKRNTPLSPAALEVLSLVAYNQPVSRAFIDQVRGVDSSSPVTTLLGRGLIREAGRLDLPGKPVCFETTDVFLRCFSLSSLDELPAIHAPEAEELPE